MFLKNPKMHTFKDIPLIKNIFQIIINKNPKWALLFLAPYEPEPPPQPQNEFY